jgi:predicted ribosomally synthesized peptide with SipW-like signal peptide
VARHAFVIDGHHLLKPGPERSDIHSMPKETPSPEAAPAMPASTADGRERSTTRGAFFSVAAVIVAFVVSLVAVSILVVTSSIAVFSDSTSNAGNSFTAGTVTLVDDDASAAMFTVTGMLPGQSVTDCIEVTYQGTAPDPGGVKVYSGGYTDSGDLDTYLNLTIEEGTGGSFGDCTGFTSSNTIESGGTLSDFDTAHTNYGNGAGVWDPASTPVSTTYRVTVELDGAAPDAEQGESITAMTITWEVQS